MDFGEASSDARECFIKVIQSADLIELRIPPAWVKDHFPSEEMERVTLNGPCGKWDAKLEHRDDGVYIVHGWQDFVTSHRLGDNELAMFLYNGGMSFDVKIYGKERNYQQEGEMNVCDKCTLNMQLKDSSDITTWPSSSRSLPDYCIELERQLLEATNECTEWRSALEVSNAQKEQLEQEKAHLEHQNAQLEQDLMESRNTCDELNRQLADLLPPPEDEGIIREFVKCLVFGGMDELMISLRLVSSIEGSSGTAWKVLRFALGFVVGGASILIPKVWELRMDELEYRKRLGRREMWKLHLPLVIAYFLFGLVGPFVFWIAYPGYEDYYKMLPLLPVYIISIISLAAGDAYTQRAPRPYRRIILTRLFMSVASFFISFLSESK